VGFTPWLGSASNGSCPETVPVGVSGLWEFIAPRPDLRSGRGLNQSCSLQRELSNVVSHSRSARRKHVDSRLFVVGSQIASLTPGPSFAHNLGCRCRNDQCKAIFDIYVLRPLQWHQERLNARCFGPCCWALNIRESQKTPNPQLWKCWASAPHFSTKRGRGQCWSSEIRTRKSDKPYSPTWTCIKPTTKWLVRILEHLGVRTSHG
jgi:hypothetical protein